MKKYKQKLRPLFGKQYKHGAAEQFVFSSLYKIEFIHRDMMVQRKSASKYLEMIVKAGLLEKNKKKDRTLQLLYEYGAHKFIC